MRTPGEIRAGLDAAYRTVKRLLKELPSDCYRGPDVDVYEALRRWRDPDAAAERSGRPMRGTLSGDLFEIGQRVG